LSRLSNKYRIISDDTFFQLKLLRLYTAIRATLRVLTREV